MAILMDSTTGAPCGAIGDDQDIPPGYWKRPDTAPDHMAALDFLDALGPQLFAASWAAAQQNAGLLFQVFRGVAAQNVFLADSFPQLVQLEQAGVLPAGTAVRVWGGI